MYSDKTTIKRRLFFSNIRMIFISFVAFVLTVRLVIFLTHGRGGPGPHNQAVMEYIRYSIDRDSLMTAWIIIFAFFTILVSVINNIITHRMTKGIVKTLEPLSEGGRQIQAGNFAYRVNYKGNDEFRPVFDAFNEMVKNLETSNAQRQKEEARRRELIAGISHDLRTPLTSIKGYIEGIETGVAFTPEMQKKYFSIIKSKTADLEHIVEQLFLFSKLDMDDFPLNMRRCDIGLVVSDIVENSSAEYAARGLALNLAASLENIFVSTDVLLFRNVIVNILENSVKYKTSEHGQMEISIAAENDCALLRFADNGPGVQEEMLPKLFNVFYRADPSRSKQGSGLGLAISAKIIERMGGSIHAEPSAAGGLAVVIKLPLEKPALMKSGSLQEEKNEP